ncbi:MAG TPA: hypothetical protein VGO67_20485 [Verrucomicrobiae bacterium]|jgi:hypothetical protein
MKTNFPKCRTAASVLAATATAMSLLYFNAHAAETGTTGEPPGTPPSSTAQPASLPYGVADVVNMWRSGTKPADLIAFVKGTAVPYQLTADQLIQLRTIGLPPEVIQAIIQRGAQLKQEKQVPPPPPSAILAYGGVGGEDYVNTPFYEYDYPYYGYNYPYDEWPIYVGPLGGFYGHGHGYGFHSYHNYGYHGYSHGYHGGGHFGGGFHGGAARGGGHGSGGHGGGSHR